jgi:transcription initiation factor TFIIIB Brf1 subunit/transcription initiation factor TFIIB
VLGKYTDVKKMSLCLHTNEIIDHHEGTIICVDCGIVKDTYYDCSAISKDTILQNHSSSQVENIVDQLHLPEEFIQVVENNISTSKNKNSLINNQRKNTLSVKKLASEIYNAVNANNSNLLLKDLMNFSHLSAPQIKSKDILLVNLSEITEKYTKKFNIDYKNYTVIKDEVMKYNNTGFQPLTIIGGTIYLHFEKIGLEIPMCEIAKTLGISTASIQRFTKNNRITTIKYKHLKRKSHKYKHAISSRK